MFFETEENALIARRGNETVRVEGWGENSLRVRATVNAGFTGEDHALGEAHAGGAVPSLCEDGAQIVSGRLRCFVHTNGWMAFYAGDRLLLKEYYRDFSFANEHSPSMKLAAREYKPHGSDYALTARFEAQEEKIFGMGQYQQPEFDLKGCILELAQRNSQISVPFFLSSRGYGFLWNSEGVGEAAFGTNFTRFFAACGDEIDYFITAGETPKQILAQYTAAVGRAPRFPAELLGLWQSKLRYRTQEEVLSVAREYARRGLPLDVIVIDFFHWMRQGDWSFDPAYWPDPSAMTEELHRLGTKCMVSVWPTVDRKSVNFSPMLARGLFVRTERGSMQCFDFQGDTVIYDATHPAAREYLFSELKRNYLDCGVDLFWLDEAEPEYSAYDFDHFRYLRGPVVKVGNSYPKFHAKGIFEGMEREGKLPVSLIRSAWVGSQKYGALVWSGDIFSNFASLRDQLAAGLNLGIAGIPWWTTDTGGFFGDVDAPFFKELLVRWFEFSVFSPVLRLHGDRGPHDIPNLSEGDCGGGFSPTGRDNELWSYGEEVYEILKKYLAIRLSLRDYLLSVFDEASENGSPVIRPLFYEFPADARAWEVSDEYMLGGKYLVAPVLYEGMRERTVYLPTGRWRSFHDGTEYGGGEIRAAAPLDIIPVFERIR